MVRFGTSSNPNDSISDETIIVNVGSDGHQCWRIKKKTGPNIQDLNTITRIYLSYYTTPVNQYLIKKKGFILDPLDPNVDLLKYGAKKSKISIHG